MSFFKYYYPTCLSYTQCLNLIQTEFSALTYVPEPFKHRLDLNGWNYPKRLESVWDSFPAFPYDAQLLTEILQWLGYVVFQLCNGLNTIEDAVYIVSKPLLLN